LLHSSVSEALNVAFKDDVTYQINFVLAEGNKKENQQIKSLQQNGFKKKATIRHSSNKKPSLIPTMMNSSTGRIKIHLGI